MSIPIMICQRCSTDLTTAVKLKEAALTSNLYFKNFENNLMPSPSLKLPKASISADISPIPEGAQKTFGTQRKVLSEIKRPVPLGSGYNKGNFVNKFKAFTSGELTKKIKLESIDLTQDLSSIPTKEIESNVLQTNSIGKVIRLLNGNEIKSVKLTPSVTLCKVPISALNTGSCIKKELKNEASPAAKICIDSCIEMPRMKTYRVCQPTSGKKFKVKTNASTGSFENILRKRFGADSLIEELIEDTTLGTSETSGKTLLAASAIENVDENAIEADFLNYMKN